MTVTVQQSAFDLQQGQWAIAWPGRVSRHDLVYETPPEDPMQGFPLGNGDLGAVCWCEGSRLIIQINKCDLWDDGAPRHLSTDWSDEEASTHLVHAARLIIDFTLPVFDPFYLADFQGRLSLADATMTLSATGPLGKVAVTAFVSREARALCISVESTFSEETPITITMERFGSRAFGHWYNYVVRDPQIGLGGTAAFADAESIGITQQVAAGLFACGCQLVTPHEQVISRIVHQRAAQSTIAGSRSIRFTLTAAATSVLEKDPVHELTALLHAVRHAGLSPLYAAHCAEWKAFWLRSLMECGDDYLDNLWHVTMYYLNSSQRGAYPGRFSNGLWAWNRDVQPWTYYYHWDQQTLYWPLNAAGHHDLVDTYLQFRFMTLPMARRAARDLFGVDGAFVSDVSERRGYYGLVEKDNHTPVMEIALDFWRQYRYTGDREFLLHRALPYMIDAALFLESRFHLEEDGCYHAEEGTALEGNIIFRDVVSEIVYGRALFPAVLAALADAGLHHAHADRWQYISEHLVPLPVMQAEEQLLAHDAMGWRFALGPFKGEWTPSNDLLAVGYRVDQGGTVIAMQPMQHDRPPLPGVHELIPLIETTFLPQYNDMECVDVMPEVEYLSVFPAGLIGLANQGSPLYTAAANIVKLCAPGSGGYDRIPIVLARLGLGREAWQIIATMPHRWQCYCNGFGHNNWGMKADHTVRFRLNYPLDTADSSMQTRFPCYSWPFRHTSMESMSVLACAMNEALLQSHEGIIRIAPAVREGQQARFTLHAIGGFVVSAEVADGKPTWVHLHSLYGACCRVAFPWTQCALLDADGHVLNTFSDGIAEFDTTPGTDYLLAPETSMVVQWHCVPEEPHANEHAKDFGDGHAQLGLPRMF
jgi:hypothetical protein